MKTIYSIFFSLLILSFTAQDHADELATNKGPLLIQPVHHGCLVLTWNAKTIYVDPYGDIKAFEGLKKPDLILITDIHPDHLNPETLNALDLGATPIIAPQAVADMIPDMYKPLVQVLKNDAKTEVVGLAILAVPMYNLPEEPDSKHPKGRGNGYVLSLGGKTIYISGDTEDIPEMRKLKNIDVAFVCMNLPYTMDVQQAASAVLEFKPRIVYPYHYRGKDGLSDVNTFKDLVEKGKAGVDVRLRDWYATK